MPNPVLAPPEAQRRKVIRRAAGTAQAKKEALAAADATIVDSPADIGAVTEGVLAERGLD